MSRYIDKDALIAEMERCSYETWSKGVNPTWWTQAVKVKDNIVKCIERQPTVDVIEVKHAYWKQNRYFKHIYYCSECARHIEDASDSHPSKHFPYCHCGAKMDGERTEE